MNNACNENTLHELENHLYIKKKCERTQMLLDMFFFKIFSKDERVFLLYYKKRTTKKIIGQHL